jgi:hypothetical protein
VSSQGHSIVDKATESEGKATNKLPFLCVALYTNNDNPSDFFFSFLEINKNQKLNIVIRHATHFRPKT